MISLALFSSVILNDLQQCLRIIVMCGHNGEWGGGEDGETNRE